VKDYLTRHGVQFELKNVARDRQALEEFRQLGALLPPVTVIDGTIVVGYQPDRFDELLFRE
jgi:glutaredoxin 3